MEDILRAGLAELGLTADEGQIGALVRYGERLMEVNRITNLTAIRDEADAARLHFLDSAALLTLADFSGKSVVDVGSGAGFPGVPLRVLGQDVELTVIDSVGKKVDFVRDSCRAVGLEDVTCIWGRAEEMSQLRERFDVAVSRAVAELDMLAELCLPLVKVGGLFLAMKKPDCDEEAARGEFAVKALGGRIRQIRRYAVPGTDTVHAVVMIEKVRPTPGQYPRRWAQISKKPLRG